MSSPVSGGLWEEFPASGRPVHGIDMSEVEGVAIEYGDEKSTVGAVMVDGREVNVAVP